MLAGSEVPNILSRIGGLFNRLVPTALYEVKPHRSYGDTRDGNATLHAVGPRLRQYARHLDQNHDLVHGALDRLTQFIVGPSGIGIEPQPRLPDGEVHAEFSAALLEAWRDWTQWPEVTWELDWAACQRLLCRSWLRDGEALVSLVRGLRTDLDHGTRVPFSLELLEADYLAFEYSDVTLNIIHSVERNGWNRPRAYHLYKQHPGQIAPTDLVRRRVPASNILHLKLIDRIGQVRGVSQLASVLQRMNGIYQYETAEMVAAEIAASLTGALKTENPAVYSPPSPDEDVRSFDLQPGMILDNLRPGESLDIFSSNRPSPTVETFRNGQLRAAAAGMGLSYSSLSRDYNGTYSAQRQELVEQFDAYRILSAQFINQVVRPVWQEFVQLALQSGVVTLPPALDSLTADDASFQPPVMPWVDPAKEASAQKELLDHYLTSPQTLIRQRGGNPDTVLNDWQRWNRMLATRTLTTPTKKPTAVAAAPEKDPADPQNALADSVVVMREQMQRIESGLLARSDRRPVSDPQSTNVTVINQLPDQPPPQITMPTPDVIINNAMPTPDVIINNSVQVPDPPPPVVHVNVEAAPAPTVHIVNEVQPAAVQVSLPSRKTETLVERDAAGQIVRATQVETDLETPDTGEEQS